MSFHLKRNLVIFAILLFLVQLANCQDEVPPESEEEEDDSSSEETVEDSNESGNRRRRRRRSMESLGDPASKSKEVDGKNNRAIPGLPDPATILKIAEILTSVGQQILPVLVEGNMAGDLLTTRLERDRKLVKEMKNEIDMIHTNLKLK